MPGNIGDLQVARCLPRYNARVFCLPATCRLRHALVPTCLAAWLMFVPAGPAHAAPNGVAALVFDLKTGATLSSDQPDVMSRAVLPGSVMKIAAVAAALESGAITDRTTVACTRTVVVNGHRLTCTHPDLHRPLNAADALTHSCNVYVATVAARVPRDVVDRVRTSLGLPPSGTTDLRTAALGLEGVRITPRALVQAVARVASPDAPPSWKPATLEVIRRGLRGAATVGTAAALNEHGIDALAKTGTVDAGGISQGLVVGVTPSTNPTRGFAVLVAGAAGRDAAAVAAERLGAGPGGGGHSREGRLKPDPTNDPRSAPANESRSGVRLQADLRPPGSSDSRRIRVGVVQRDGQTRVREMALDEYVAGVIAGEQATGSAPQALEALAIVARTYALANAGRHASEGFDVCDLTHCQVLRAATPASRAAALRTSGAVLLDGDRPAEVFYTASCGGHTEKPSNVWRGAHDSSYLPSRHDEACGGAPAWQSEVSARDLQRVLRQAGFRGDALRGMRITRRTDSGRVAWLALDGLAPAEISGENLRTLVGRVLGWQHLRSTLFDVTRTGTGYRFTGRGAGHGVGLCVLGAAARASQGADARAILREYFPGLDVKAPGSTAASATLPQVRLQLPAEERAGQAELQRLATTWLAETARTLSEGRLKPTPANGASHDGTAHSTILRLRFHPTVESYQRQTGSPWFTTATTTRDGVDLIPLRVLRERGVLEPTLRHEFVHALTFDALRGAPRWVSEGLAELAATQAGRAAGTDTRAGRAGWAGRTEAQPRGAYMGANCPDDGEFRRAPSGDALRRLYARAAACVERELQAGGGWQHLGARR